MFRGAFRASKSYTKTPLLLEMKVGFSLVLLVYINWIDFFLCLALPVLLDLSEKSVRVSILNQSDFIYVHLSTVCSQKLFALTCY